jgi:hypothetical protein
LWTTFSSTRRRCLVFQSSSSLLSECIRRGCRSLACWHTSGNSILSCSMLSTLVAECELIHISSIAVCRTRMHTYTHTYTHTHTHQVHRVGQPHHHLRKRVGANRCHVRSSVLRRCVVGRNECRVPHVVRLRGLGVGRLEPRSLPCNQRQRRHVGQTKPLRCQGNQHCCPHPPAVKQRVGAPNRQGPRASVRSRRHEWADCTWLQLLGVGVARWRDGLDACSQQDGAHSGPWHDVSRPVSPSMGVFYQGVQVGRKQGVRKTSNVRCHISVFVPSAFLFEIGVVCVSTCIVEAKSR